MSKETASKHTANAIRHARIMRVLVDLALTSLGVPPDSETFSRGRFHDEFYHAVVVREEDVGIYSEWVLMELDGQ